MLKKHMTPLSKGGQLVKNVGKGALPFPQPKPGALTAAAPSMNNYAKATPLPTPPPAPMGGASPMGIGAGGSPGQDQGMV